MPEATITKRFTFAAGHHLPWHQGKCHGLHGHNYVLEVSIRGPVKPDQEGDPEAGMVLDFDRISASVKPFIEEFLDHKYLNDTLHPNPTAENIALNIYGYLTGNMPDVLRTGVLKVRLQETETGWVEVGG